MYHLWMGIKVFADGTIHFGVFDFRRQGQPLWRGFKEYQPGNGPIDDRNCRLEVGIFDVADVHNRLWRGRRE
jgi:hypothetical protein